ncbi:hypothetical protein, partial [Methanospirillum hungatei]|uniref:hypothetical protein n=1 Tax=Methanospirillum hungatei TaxID=2203 RepID=UPI0026EF422F
MREEIPFGSGSFPYREALCVLFRRNQAVTENMEYIRNEDVLVLIVDDNKNNLSIITEVLHRSGYQVMTSTDGP